MIPKSKLDEADIPALQVSKEWGVGAECSFLGYPYAATWTATFSGVAYKMPFIKHCYISGMVRVPAGLFVLDGINNQGFSGGPVLYKTGSEQTVVGVISGYRIEPAVVHSIDVPDTSTVTTPSSKQTAPVKTKKADVVDLNSGLITAYAADVAVDAIRKQPKEN